MSSSSSSSTAWTVTSSVFFFLFRFFFSATTGASPPSPAAARLSSSSPSNGRAPQFRRNAFPSNGIRNVDARVSRDVQLHEGLSLQFFVEAFNVANRRQITSFNTTAYQYTNATTIVPFTSTPFGSPASTSSVLYGPRQMQFTAKMFF